MSERPDEASKMLWALRGHGREVRCLRQRSRGCFELRILWGDELFLNERFATSDKLAQRAEEFRATLESRGWKPTAALDTPQSAAPAPPVAHPGPPPGAPVPPGPEAEPGAERAPSPAPDERAAVEPVAAVSGESLRPVVLVVDDEEAVRTFMRNYLQGAGYVAREAEDVDAALALLDEGGIDAVVLDIRMPDRMGWGRTGLEVLAFMRLHAAYTELPVLVLTGHPLSAEELGIIRRHNADLFTKPDGYRLLLARLNELVGQRSGPRH